MEIIGYDESDLVIEILNFEGFIVYEEEKKKFFEEEKSIEN